jgi:threonine dehydrogenase-like Zn-dependent dehydrogenase
MKALVTDGYKNLTVVDINKPVIGEYECLVKIEACAFCNSTDRHLVDGSFPFHHKYPAVLGHESVGSVVQIGNKVKHFKIADRILRSYAIYPDDELNGMASCWGGFAEYGKVTDYRSMLENKIIFEENVPNTYKYQQAFDLDISPVEASLMIPFKEIYSAVQQIKHIDGKRILIAGAGIVSLLFGRFLRLSGAESVCLSARRKESLDFALKYESADLTVLSTELDSLTKESFDILIDATGSISFAKSLLPFIKKQGNIFAYGIYEDIINFISSNKIKLTPYISHVFPLERYKEAWNTILSKSTLKTVITFD